MRPFRQYMRLALLLCAGTGWGQDTPVRVPGQIEGAKPTFEQKSPGVWRFEGTESWSGVRYVRVLLMQAPGSASETQPDLKQPTLTGQCTQDAKGKQHFELFANFGGVMDAAFYPPWHATGPDDAFPPRTTKVSLTMEFLGYTRVKPFKRQFEQVTAPGPEQMRYMNPGGGSSNMEPPGWFFQYLRALPTLRLTGGGHTAEFETAGWLKALHGEPLCGASGA